MAFASGGCTRIYTVDDEHFTIHLWCQLESDQLFPGLSFDGADNIEAAIIDGQSSSAPTLYILDSRLPISAKLLEEIREPIRNVTGTDVVDIKEDDVLTGVFAAAWLKIKRPDSKVILLTAFGNTIKKLAEDMKVQELLVFACDEMLSKPCSELSVRHAISKYVRTK